MKVFVSHAAKDRSLAEELARELSQSGLNVWNPYDQIEPGDNWHKEVGKALEQSDLMIVLLTPSAMESRALRSEIDYALTTTRYRNRLLTVMVGPAFELPTETPWILVSLPHIQVESITAGASQIVAEVKALAHS